MNWSFLTDGRGPILIFLVLVVAIPVETIMRQKMGPFHSFREEIRSGGMGAATDAIIDKITPMTNPLQAWYYLSKNGFHCREANIADANTGFKDVRCSYFMSWSTLQSWYIVYAVDADGKIGNAQGGVSGH